MPQWIYIINPCRPDFITTSTDEENAKVGEHFHYLKGLLAEGKLILAGRTQDDVPQGYVIYEADDEQEAQRMFEEDPAVKAGVFVGKVRPYFVALSR